MRAACCRDVACGNPNTRGSPQAMALYSRFSEQSS